MVISSLSKASYLVEGFAATGCTGGAVPDPSASTPQVLEAASCFGSTVGSAVGSTFGIGPVCDRARSFARGAAPAGRPMDSFFFVASFFAQIPTPNGLSQSAVRARLWKPPADTLTARSPTLLRFARQSLARLSRAVFTERTKREAGRKRKERPRTRYALRASTRS